ncbi:lytic transglycosylase domain-containing protein [Terriglobus albidus]|uniref:lytic transglycosylase domain-containing protein n=1 Tax=Terriglobus albidus TaxID=1592106 RepID=UPI0021DF95FD|nr:transglycosylase SLT domain-containing protein [Terriglobus albidus]
MKFRRIADFLPFCFLLLLSGTVYAQTTKAAPKKPAAKAPVKAGAGKGTKRAGSGKTARGRRKKVISSPPTARSRKLTSAFVASSQLRPMAQQLTATRSPAAYAGVLAYANSHSGEASAAAWLAMGHAYMLDKRFADAYNAFRQAAQRGEALDDYADYLGAQAALQGGRGTDAYALLENFAQRHPGSIFVANAPVALANGYLQQNDPQGALRVLSTLAGTPQASHADFRFAQARAWQLAGNTNQAAAMYRSIYTLLPLSYEATQARVQLQAMGTPLTATEHKVHADQLYNAKRYAEAADEYHSIQHDATLSPGDRDALDIYAAVCDLKLKRLSKREAESLPQTDDDSAALKLYLLAELARSSDDRGQHGNLVTQLTQRYPRSRWTEEALYSAGNMYLLKHEYGTAAGYYSQLVSMFPRSTYGPSSHWRAGWLSYRTRNYSEAARLMDEQIQRYSTGIETPSALYWRGRIYEEQEHNLAQAANYYRTLSDSFPNYYYALLARQRLDVLGKQPAVAPAAPLASVRAPDVPELIDTLPENDTHLIKARLLANAGLNEYIAPEIQASPTSSTWGTLAQAEIYTSYGEYVRALQAMKRSGASYFAYSVDDVPEMYWKLLFPTPYWNELTANASRNSLDPYLVASLIRQESEFNPGAVSRANAYGLMQMLPSVGKSLAKKDGIGRFSTNDLLQPAISLRLGTTYLRQTIDRFGGQVEYALAAYNAGDTPVRQWMSTNDYRDMAEFVESIPYTETREYVQAILRNREMYRAIYGKGQRTNTVSALK